MASSEKVIMNLEDFEGSDGTVQRAMSTWSSTRKAIKSNATLIQKHGPGPWPVGAARGPGLVPARALVPVLTRAAPTGHGPGSWFWISVGLVSD